MLLDGDSHKPHENASPVPDAKGVTHTSPGQRHGLTPPNSLPALKARFIVGMSQAVGLGPKQIARAPRALPWAGMKQAVGLKIPVDESIQQIPHSAFPIPHSPFCISLTASPFCILHSPFCISFTASSVSAYRRLSVFRFRRTG